MTESGSATSIRRIALVNRGDAAARALHAIRDLTLERGVPLTAVALHVEGEELAPFVRGADERYCLGPALAPRTDGSLRRNAYVDMDLLRAALIRTRVDAAWVGWGFVSEAADFADLCAELGITFIGPPADALRHLGDKARAKSVAEQVSVPVVPWSGGPLENAEQARRRAEELGLPLLVKATAGGGGRGIRRVDRMEDLATAVEVASAEAAAAFGDGSVILERFVASPRHLEVQVVADVYGDVTTLGVRDCTVQRRRQKVVEEAGVDVVPDRLAARLEQSAADLVRAVGYRNVGTVEFLLDQATDEFYFMEVNPRLQVEHTVTEAVTGVDLVKLQLDLAQGSALGKLDTAARGYAIEARVTAEDPLDGFRPSPGRLSRLHHPTGPGVRVDCGLEEGSQVPPEFDPLICKVIGVGRDRGEAVARLRRSLSEASIVIAGGASNLGFVQGVLAHPSYHRRAVDTNWLDTEAGSLAALGERTLALSVLAAATELARSQIREQERHLMSTAAQGRPELARATANVIEMGVHGRSYSATVTWRGPGEYAVEVDGQCVELQVKEPDGLQRLVTVNGEQHEVCVTQHGGIVQVDIGGWTHRLSSDHGGVVRAPAPGVVVSVRVRAGERVEPGQVLAVLESMKLEVTVRAERAGTVRETVVLPNTQVDAGDPLALMEADDVVSGSPTSAAPLGVEALVAVDRPAGELLGEARRCLLGYDPVAGWRDTTVARLRASEQGSTALEIDLADEVELLRSFADIAAVTRRTPSTIVQGAERTSAAQALLYAFMRRPESSPDWLPLDFRVLLSRCLTRMGVPSLDSGPELREGLHRLIRAAQGLDDVAVVLVHLIRRWLVSGLSHTAAEALGDLSDLLAQDVDGRFPAVAHAIRVVLHDAGWTDARTGVAWADEPAAALPRELAERTEMWRLERFDLSVLASASDAVLVRAVARDYEEDRRLIVWSEACREPTPAGEIMVRVESQLTRAFAMIRSGLLRRFESPVDFSNRVVLYVDSPWDPTDAELSELAGRLAATGQGLALDKILLRIRRPATRGGEPIGRLLHFADPDGGAPRFGETPPAPGPMRPLTPQRNRLLRLRRRGLHDPYEIVDLLISPHTRVSPFGRGSFQEYDLDESGRLTPVSRPVNQNAAGVVLGVIENITVDHPEGLRRVIVLSDPSKGMGALAEPECRRILGALDLAENLGLPVEWFAVSAGARVSMSVGTESMDWVARVLRRIVHLTEAGCEINVIVAGVTVGAQPYFQAEATMLMHTKGILVMIQGSSMVLTGKDALDFAGGVSAEDNPGIGGYERVMGGNGEAQYWARDLEMACDVLMRHYGHTYVAPRESGARGRSTSDPVDRDVSLAPHRFGDEFTTVGQIFDDRLNPGRRKPFSMRSVMDAVIDAECRPLERWSAMIGGEGVIVWDAHLGGDPVCLIGVDSRSQPRWGPVAADGPRTWTGATLFPRSSKKMARAINAASGNRPVVLLASLAGFDGSPESMRELQLEYGAEIARAVTKFDGPIVFCIVSRNHGGAFVVFSKQLNDRLQCLAIRGSEASVIGGSAAAAVVFAREVEHRAMADARVVEVLRSWEGESESVRVETAPRLARTIEEARADARTGVAREFDAIHTVERALRVGSVDRIIRPEDLREELVTAVRRGLGRPPVEDDSHQDTVRKGRHA